jgi:hypothetical protein
LWFEDVIGDETREIHILDAMNGSSEQDPLVFNKRIGLGQT